MKWKRTVAACGSRQGLCMGCGCCVFTALQEMAVFDNIGRTPF